MFKFKNKKFSAILTALLITSSLNINNLPESSAFLNDTQNGLIMTYISNNEFEISVPKNLKAEGYGAAVFVGPIDGTQPNYTMTVQSSLLYKRNEDNSFSYFEYNSEGNIIPIDNIFEYDFPVVPGWLYMIPMDGTHSTNAGYKNSRNISSDLCVNLYNDPAAIQELAQQEEVADGVYYMDYYGNNKFIEGAVIINGIVYKLNKDCTATVLGGARYSFVGGNVVLLNTVTKNGINYTVTRIAKDAFSRSIWYNDFNDIHRRNITSVTIPASAVEIETGAFFGCENLTNVIFEEGSRLRKICCHSFENCAIRNVIIPASVEVLEYSFKSKLLESFKFEKGSKIEKIPNGIFHHSKIRELNIPASVTEIGFCACKDCLNLETVHFEKGSQLKKLESYAFADNPNLREINLPEGVTLGHDVFKNSPACKFLN